MRFHIGHKVLAVRHKAYNHLFSRIAPYYLVNEYPKSGGTWLAEMLAEAMGLPFRRNCPVRFEKAVTHGHFYYRGFLKPILLWRDPRDIIVSYYFHCYFKNEHGNEMFVEHMKRHCSFEDYNSVRNNLPTFIRSITEKPPSPRFSWPQFAKIWLKQKSVISVKYENLRSNPVCELQRILDYTCGRGVVSIDLISSIAHRHSFDEKKKRLAEKTVSKPEVSFLRRGVVGGWKEYFDIKSENELARGNYLRYMRSLGYV